MSNLEAKPLGPAFADQLHRLAEVTQEDRGVLDDVERFDEQSRRVARRLFDGPGQVSPVDGKALGPGHAGRHSRRAQVNPARSESQARVEGPGHRGPELGLAAGNPGQAGASGPEVAHVDVDQDDVDSRVAGRAGHRGRIALLDDLDFDALKAGGSGGAEPLQDRVLPKHHRDAATRAGPGHGQAAVSLVRARRTASIVKSMSSLVIGVDPTKPPRRVSTPSASSSF